MLAAPRQEALLLDRVTTDLASMLLTHPSSPWSSCRAAAECATLRIDPFSQGEDPRRAMTPFQREMYAELSHRLNHEPQAVAAMWRLLRAPVAARIVDSSMDPGAALDDALRQVQAVLLERRGRDSAAPSLHRRRRHRPRIAADAALPPALPVPLRARAADVLAALRTLRLAVGTRGCHAGPCRWVRAELRNGAGGGGPAAGADRPDYSAVALPTVLPPVARRVLFPGALERALGSAAASGATSDPPLATDWAALLEEAEDDLRAFDDWVRRQQQQGQPSGARV